MVIQHIIPFPLRPRFQQGRHRARPAGFSVQGFTLIELLVVVALVAVLLGLGVPGFRELITATRIKNASFDVFSSLIHARSEAITRNTTVTVTPVGGNWAGGWTVTCADATTCKDPATNAPPLVIRLQDAYPNITISGPVSIGFNGMGRLNAAVDPFSFTATGVIDRNKRCVTLNPSGRPITKPPVNTGFTCP